MQYPTGDEGLGSCICCDMLKWNCFNPSSETINTCQEVGVSSLGGERSNNINVHMIESCVRGCEGGER